MLVPGVQRREQRIDGRLVFRLGQEFKGKFEAGFHAQFHKGPKAREFLAQRNGGELTFVNSLLLRAPIDVSLQIGLFQALDPKGSGEGTGEVTQVHGDGLERILLHCAVGMNSEVTAGDLFKSQCVL
ncbi:MAG: hypothetical protein HC767_14430, partial [Akkermansiaceae bacterium]|nr:hypothetical protein [Akkermansiaceae bacterium]